ncbi:MULTISPECIES: Lrp/AsnC family transcriptional regulator [unclassified Amycolatopsis]|uniref:Lrp/AsnC family transcriptional regulator n=1 Tax=unclassified Amycolatopsis TaxID=2618356 RepID=UPI001C6A0BFE|nr:Lrp/AsnC family transcriptional regulator [Amycolatopsis sp. DSM 110486]QYN20878.1 Lrp/AsnC family transcriptional regulator [Amycolatopsis sp. DSM 110486]
MVSNAVLEDDDIRLIAALQCDGRVTIERAAAVLGLNQRAVRRRLRVLLDGVVRVVATRPRAAFPGVTLLRIRVLRGKIDAVTAALAARDDVLYLDLSHAGDEISAAVVSDPSRRNALVFRQLPATTAVTEIHAETVMHVFSDASDWRLDVLTETERADLTVMSAQATTGDLDSVDSSILTTLARDARLPAAAVAAEVRHPESTVRRRLATLRTDGRLLTQTFVDPHHLGLRIDANITMHVPPAKLDHAGRTLAHHPAVHGALATTGSSNLHAAVWLRDLDHLYRFVTEDLAQLGVERVETFLVGQAVKRPGK